MPEGQSQEADDVGRLAAGRRPPSEEKEVAPSSQDGESGSVGVEESRFPTAVSLKDYFFTQCKQVVFFICQKERCPRTGRLHYQGYIRCASAVAFSTIKKMLPTAHWELALGNEKANIEYCSKNESRVEGEEAVSFGDVAAPGKRKDIEIAREIIECGGGMRQVVKTVSSYQAIKGAEVALKYLEPGRDFKPEVRWYHGETGSGKTRSALEEFPEAWISGKNLKWFEGYDAHEVVVVDDFRKDFCTFHELLRILDRYPYRVETKGSSRQLLAKVIIITCPWSPEVLYQGRSAEDIGQLTRRIDVVKLFGQVVPPPVLFVRHVD